MDWLPIMTCLAPNLTDCDWTVRPRDIGAPFSIVVRRVERHDEYDAEKDIDALISMVEELQAENKMQFHELRLCKAEVARLFTPPTCRDCGSEIAFVGQTRGKKYPINLDGTRHHCEEFKDRMAQQVFKVLV